MARSGCAGNGGDARDADLEIGTTEPAEIFGAYLTILASVRFEMAATVAITTLFAVGHRLRLEHARRMLEPIPFLRPVLDIPYGHHERWDGSGYPRGLAGEEIPLAARLFAVVDVWDALLSERPYRQAWTREEAARHLRQGVGTLFDPRVVEVFLRRVVGNDIEASAGRTDGGRATTEIPDTTPAPASRVR